MDFDQLPKEIFEQILSYLPLKEIIRMERVSKRYQEISQGVISKTKLIDSTEEPYRRMDGEAISKLLQLCKSNLEEINIIEIKNSWIESFSQFSYPRLVQMSVAVKLDADVNVNDFFGQIMAKNKKLETVLWLDYVRPVIYSKDVVCEKLERVWIETANNDTFRSMIGKLPNLKELVFNHVDLVTHENFDNFFATCPNMEIFKISEWKTTTFRIGQLIHFWRLFSMKKLRLRYSRRIGNLLLSTPVRFDDDDFEKISTSFPLLEEFYLNDVMFTNRGLVALASLKNLRKISLCYAINLASEMYQNIDSGIRELTKECEHLQILMIPGVITSATMTALVRYCRELRQICTMDVVDVNTIDEAVAVVRSFGGFVKRNISIDLCTKKEIWNSDDVKKVLDELTADGHVIKIING